MPELDKPKSDGGSSSNNQWFLYMLAIAGVTVLVMYGLNKYQEGRLRSLMGRMDKLQTFNARGTLGCDSDIAEDGDDFEAEKYGPGPGPGPGPVPVAAPVSRRENFSPAPVPTSRREHFYADPDPVSAPSPVPAPEPAPAPVPKPVSVSVPALPPFPAPVPGPAPAVQRTPMGVPEVVGANRPAPLDQYNPIDMMAMAGPVKQAPSQTSQMQAQQARQLGEMEQPELPSNAYFDNENPADAVVYDRQIIARIKPAYRNAPDFIRGDLFIPRDPNRGMFAVSDTAMRELNAGALSQISDVQVSVSKTDLLYSRGTERDVMAPPGRNDETAGWDLYLQPPKRPYT